MYSERPQMATSAMLSDGSTLLCRTSALATKTTIPVLPRTRGKDRRQGHRTAGLEVFDLLLLALLVASLGHVLNISGQHLDLHRISKKAGLSSNEAALPDI